MANHPSKEGPIQRDVVEQMNLLAKTIDELLNGKVKPKKWGFALLVFSFGGIIAGSGRRANYISNANREDMVAAMKEFIARSELRYVEGTERG